MAKDLHVNGIRLQCPTVLLMNVDLIVKNNIELFNEQDLALCEILTISNRLKYSDRLPLDFN